MKKVYNKLVRDKINQVIEGNNQRAEFRYLKEEEYLQELHKKLYEEVNEFVEDDDKEELADVLEVLYSIAKTKNIDMDEVERIRIAKREKRGGFEDKLYLETVEDLKGEENE